MHQDKGILPYYQRAASMTSSGGADNGDRSPAAGTRELVDDLIEVRDRAAMLQTMLQWSPTLPSAAGDAEAAAGTKELVDGMMTRLSSALSTLGTNGGGGRGSGERRKKGAATGPHRRSSSCRRRSRRPFPKTVTAKKVEDGQSWRKYGQKSIQDSPNPRSYFRCTHRPDQGCMATKQVQQSGSNPSEFVIRYFGEHTCRDPSTIPFVIIDTAAPVDCANLISFGSAIGATINRSTNATAHRLMRVAIDPMIPGSFVNYGSPMPQECASEEALRSSSPACQLAAVVGSAGRTSPTVGSVHAEYWPGGVSGDMAGGAGSFPSSPSSLGFMTGSFGSFGNAGDDDLFGFDP